MKRTTYVTIAFLFLLTFTLSLSKVCQAGFVDDVVTWTKKTTEWEIGVAKSVISGKKDSDNSKEEDKKADADPDKDIRSVDFKNFTYHPLYCHKVMAEAGIGKTVKIKDGLYECGSGNTKAYFGVRQVYYGDINNDGHEDAVIHTVSGYDATSGAFNEIFIYSYKRGKLVLLGTLDDDKFKIHHKGILWDIKDIKVADGDVKIALYADGCHAQPDNVVTLDYAYNGKSLVLKGSPRVEKNPHD